MSFHLLFRRLQNKVTFKLIHLGSKNKLKRFKENEGFENVIQPLREDLINDKFNYKSGDIKFELLNGINFLNPDKSFLENFSISFFID